MFAFIKEIAQDICGDMHKFKGMDIEISFHKCRWLLLMVFDMNQNIICFWIGVEVKIKFMAQSDQQFLHCIVYLFCALTFSKNYHLPTNIFSINRNTNININRILNLSNS